MNENQKKVLDIYKEFTQICGKHQIQHWVTGGTVLGAIRHAGFIPWDDDIDVALKREDLDRFCENAKEWLPDYLELYWLERSQSCRIVDKRWKVTPKDSFIGLFEDNQVPGLFIDVQPFDGVNGNPIERVLHSGRVFFWRSCLKMIDSGRLYKGKRPIKEKIIIGIFLIFRILIPRIDYVIKKYDYAMRKYSVDNCMYIADYVGKYFFRDVYPKDWWYPSIECQFEDIVVPIPNGYERYLSQVYGNYMKVPEDKVTHFEA